MCGIAGWFNRKKTHSYYDLMKMCACLEHRGPDAFGTLVLNQFLPASDGVIGMGHRRLSIIDLSEDARQPMIDKTGKYAIVFNGEIYNFMQIKVELAKQYHVTFANRSDTEVLLYAYIHLREKCLELLNGMFAFAIIDFNKNELFLARDRMGVKPLYYYSMNGEFVFASVPWAILSYLNMKFTINESAIYEYFIQGYIGGGKSIAADIHQLAPGHWMKINSDGEVENQGYWDLKVEQIKGAELKIDDRKKLIPALSTLLADAVRLRLISDVPIGVFLSGGIDSTLIAALACKESAEQVKTFTIGFNEKRFDESSFAKRIAQWLHTEHHELIIGEKDFLSILPQFHDAFDEPFADESAIPMLILSRFARGKITVALSGDGGDEQYFGYTKYDHLQRLHTVYSIPYFLRRLFVSLIPKKALNFDTKIKLQSIGYKNIDECVGNIVNCFTVLDGIAIDNKRALIRRELPSADMPLENRWMINDFKGYMWEDVLTKVDRASMRFGLEVRTPLLDYRFVQCSFYDVPLAQKIKREKKSLLKGMLEAFVPREFFERRKMGFGVPLKQWVNGTLQEEIAALIEQPTILEIFFRMKTLEKLFHDRKFVLTKYGSTLFWRLYVFRKWEEKLRVITK